MKAVSPQASLGFFAGLRRAGVDEAGRGPLAGPVVAAAVILDPDREIGGLADSKQLDPEVRESLAQQIRARALAWSVAWADASEVDSLNILRATLLAMRRAVQRLPVAPGHVVVDGNRCPRLGRELTVEAVIGGDASLAEVSAASILAKVWRDGFMSRADQVFPGYGFAAHKGYGTPGHLLALDRLGPCPLHRRTFRPLAPVAGGEM